MKPFAIRTDTDFRPAPPLIFPLSSGLPDKLTYGQGVEEFIPDDKQRQVRKISQTVQPDRCKISQPFLLDRPQSGAGFHQMQACSIVKPRHILCCPQQIRHQCRPAGAEFHQRKRRR